MSIGLKSHKPAILGESSMSHTNEDEENHDRGNDRPEQNFRLSYLLLFSTSNRLRTHLLLSRSCRFGHPSLDNSLFLCGQGPDNHCFFPMGSGMGNYIQEQ